MISPKDKKIYTFVHDYIHSYGYSPTLLEIQAQFEYKSLTSVQRSIWSLEQQGYLKRNKHKNRGLRIANLNLETTNIPLVGSAPCGEPLLAQQNIEGYIQTDLEFIRGEPAKFFYLTAIGDSMNEAGIDDGDLVLVRSQPTAENGDVVVALIEDQATIKQFHKAKTYVKLMPKSSNPVHYPMILRNNLEIQGIVIQVFKG